jgi:hypothetical protein
MLRRSTVLTDTALHGHHPRRAGDRPLLGQGAGIDQQLGQQFGRLGHLASNLLDHLLA